RRAAPVRGGPGAGTRTGPGQPHRRRLRRHPVVGLAARGSARGAPERAAGDAPDRPRRHPGRRRRARRAHHEQHGAHRRDVRHRRRPAVRLRVSTRHRAEAGMEQEADPDRTPRDSLPIGDYALLSDCRSAALVSRDGSVDWLCCPRFDAPSVFCRLLDPAGGRFAIRPAGEFQASRRYVDQTMVLETTFTTAGGTAVLTDALALGRHERGHDLGTGSPGILLRRLACTGGEIEAEVSYAPRPEYGLIHPILVPVPGGLAARGGADRLLLSTPVSLDVSGDTAAARIRLTTGQAIVFALGHGQMAGPPLAPWPAEKITARLSDTVAGWRSWSAIHQNYEGPWRELVRHSWGVLQALTFAPTGAIVASPTTSLPETVGGERNWDYRYTWVRDASLTMEALWVAACPDEANKFFTFLADAAASQLEHGRDLQIMFGVGGERDLTERELPHLAGWRGSRPVRAGNGAWLQRQLDVYG